MNRKKITAQQLLAGALLKFDSVDITDLTLLQKGLPEHLEFMEDANSNIQMLEAYINIKGTRITFVSDLGPDEDLNFVLLRLLGVAPGRALMKHLENVNIADFVLRKIKHLDSPKFNISEHANPEQEKAIKIFLDHGYIKSNSKKHLTLTNKAEAYLFIENHRSLFTRFCFELSINNLDLNLINKYIETQDLKNPSTKNIFNIQNYQNFLDIYNTLPSKNPEMAFKK